MKKNRMKVIKEFFTTIRSVKTLVLWVPILTIFLGVFLSAYIYNYLENQDREFLKQNAFAQSREEIAKTDLRLANSMLRIQTYDDFMTFSRRSYESDKAFATQALGYTVFQRLSVFQDTNPQSVQDVKLKLVTRAEVSQATLPPPMAMDLSTSADFMSAIRDMKNNSNQVHIFLRDEQNIPRLSVIMRSKNFLNYYFIFTGPLISLFEESDFLDKKNIIVSDPQKKQAWVIFEKNRIRSLEMLEANNEQFPNRGKEIFRFVFDQALPRSGVPLNISYQFFEVEPASVSSAYVGGGMFLIITFIISYLFYVLISMNRRAGELIALKTIDLEKTAHDLQMALNGKTKFFGKINHEIRTPLNLILGMIDLCEENDRSGELRPYLKSMKSSGEHLLHMIDDLLEISKAESAGFQIEERATHTVQFLTDVTKLLGADCRAKGIHFYTYFSPDLPSVIFCDPNRLRQVILNLLRNAVKYTVHGHIELSVSVISVDAFQKVKMRFEIKDTGVGIPKENLGKIFDAFFQINTSAQLSEGGVGLGLSIVKDIVQKMNGKITVNSSPMEGSIFQVDLDFLIKDKKKWLESYRLERSDELRTVVTVSTNLFFQRTFSSLSRHSQIQLLQIDPTQVEDFAAFEGQKKIFVVDANVADIYFDKIFKLYDEKSILVVGRPSRLMSEFNARSLHFIDEIPILPNELLVHLGFSSRNRDRKNLVENAAHALQTPSQQEQVFKNCHMIVADDDVGNLELYRAYFAQVHGDIEYAHNGLEAWNLYQKGGIEIMVVDVRMPIMDGFELIAKIRHDEKERQKKSIPIIIVTADLLDETTQKAAVYKNVFLLTKPIRKALLFDEIAKRYSEA